jgi:hypothetical protein
MCPYNQLSTGLSSLEHDTKDPSIFKSKHCHNRWLAKILVWVLPHTHCLFMLLLCEERVLNIDASYAGLAQNLPCEHADWNPSKNGFFHVES